MTSPIVLGVITKDRLSITVQVPMDIPGGFVSTAFDALMELSHVPLFNSNSTQLKHAEFVSVGDDIYLIYHPLLNDDNRLRLEDFLERAERGNGGFPELNQILTSPECEAILRG